MTNRLAGQPSPYLLQHAGNPVAWWPWSPEAFEEARRRDVPVLLSVGYAACHWCHVMAHESFERPDVAAVMNDGFVNIKVDREERPDVDRVYLDAVTAISGSAGWPLTVFLFPDGRPFFGGTYFPRQQFVALLGQIGKVWQERRADLEADATHLAGLVAQSGQLPALTVQSPEALPPSPDLAAAARSVLAYHDAEWGGFGRAPKFPQPTLLELLLAGGETDAVTLTLDAMASGGIYDHVGGGFARYATDRRWLVPHFEKMLYDNAQLIRLYTHAWQADPEPSYAQVVAETVGYLLREPVRLSGGGLASSEDADSEGAEGRFYTWGFDELVSVGGREAASWYGASPGGNWEDTNILWRPERGALIRPEPIEQARKALFEARERRVRPGLDDKVLTEWNAMAVAAIAEAGAAFARPEWVDAAVSIAEVLLARGRNANGRWFRVVPHAADGGAPDPGAAPAFAGDYAWLVQAFVQLAEVTGHARWVTEATVVADELLRLFWDEADGGFWTSGHDAEVLIARVKEIDDGALPAASSVAAGALLRLSALTGQDRYRRPLSQLAALPQLADNPMRYPGLLLAAQQAGGQREVVVTGERPDLVATVWRAYRPGVVLAWGEPYASPLWEGRTDQERAGLAYVCRHGVCSAPVADVAALERQLEVSPR